MANRDYFIKFIIKTLVRDIEHHTIDGEFVIGRMDVSDEIIAQIVEEGKRYEYSENETRELISNIAENISWAPSVEAISYNLDINDLEIGTHLVLKFDNTQYGMVTLSIICIDIGVFFVLKSQIPGIIYHDRLKAVNPLWSINNAVEFVPYRCNRKLLRANQVLRFGHLVGIDLLKPSAIHEIYDSKSDFAKKGNKGKRVAK